MPFGYFCGLENLERGLMMGAADGNASRRIYLFARLGFPPLPAWLAASLKPSTSRRGFILAECRLGQLDGRGVWFLAPCRAAEVYSGHAHDSNAEDVLITTQLC